MHAPIQSRVREQSNPRFPTIDGRKKKCYITGRKVAPTEDDPNYDDWEAEDALVKS